MFPKVLITGATGFFGGALYDAYMRHGYDTWGTSTTVNQGRILKCDINDEEEVLRIIGHVQPEIIIHAAALSSVTRWDGLDYYKINVSGTENLLTAFNKLGDIAKLFVFISTAGVYGNQDINVLSESLMPNPVSHYGLSKFVAEQLVKSRSIAFDYLIFRPFNLIGAGQHQEFIFPKLVSHFAQKADCICLGNVNTYRDYMSVSTAAEIVRHCVESGCKNSVFNLCTGHGYSIREIMLKLHRLSDHMPKIEIDPKFVRQNEVWSLVGNPEKMKSGCGDFALTLNFDEDVDRVLKDMLQYYTQRKSI